jgi:hypothetical protein
MAADAAAAEDEAALRASLSLDAPPKGGTLDE